MPILQVSITLGTPYQMGLVVNSEHFHNSDLSSIGRFLCGGSIVPEDLCRRLRTRLPNGIIYNAYALSESCSQVSFNMPPKLDSAGLLNVNFLVKIVDDQENHCGVNESGEICLKPPYKFMGYYGNAEATRNAFDADGWFLTGDIGYFDADGYLFVIDRKKDILKYCNYQISPGEIEKVIIEHPGVAQVCVVGIPDLICTDLPAAVIVKSKGASVTEDDVLKYLDGKFMDFKKLRGGVYFVDDLPRTPSGKVLKRLVKEIAVELYSKRHAVAAK